MSIKLVKFRLGRQKLGSLREIVGVKENWFCSGGFTSCETAPPEKNGYRGPEAEKSENETEAILLDKQVGLGDAENEVRLLSQA